MDDSEEAERIRRNCVKPARETHAMSYVEMDIPEVQEYK